jgi:hypothetical protein
MTNPLYPLSPPVKYQQNHHLPLSSTPVKSGGDAFSLIKSNGQVADYVENITAVKQYLSNTELGVEAKSLIDKLGKSSNFSVEADFWVCFSELILFYTYFEFLIHNKGTMPKIPVTFLNNIKETCERNQLNFTNEYIEKSICDDIMSDQPVPIKLYISSIKKLNFVEKKLGKLLTEFGIVHVGMQIGPYIIDWNNGEICLPRMIQSSRGSALAIFDLNNTTYFPTKDFFMRVCKIITTFNKFVKYDNNARSLPRLEKDLNQCQGKANCHLFFKYLMDKLGLKYWWSNDGPIQCILNCIQEGGDPKNFKIEDLPVFSTADELNAYGLEHYSRGE